MSEGKTNELRDVKIALQKAFDSKRNALGAQLLGLIAGLFTLLQTVQNSGNQSLSGIFPGLTVITIPFTPFGIQLIVSLKLSLFIVAVFILLFLIVRTIFRFSLYSRYSDIVYWVEEANLKSFPDELKWVKKKDLLIRVLEAAGLMIAGKMVFIDRKQRQKFVRIIPHDWFIASVTWAKNTWGYVLCFAISFSFTLVLVFLLW